MPQPLTKPVYHISFVYRIFNIWLESIYTISSYGVCSRKRQKFISKYISYKRARAIRNSDIFHAQGFGHGQLGNRLYFARRCCAVGMDLSQVAPWKRDDVAGRPAALLLFHLCYYQKLIIESSRNLGKTSRLIYTLKYNYITWLISSCIITYHPDTRQVALLYRR